jgi:hypothetical protein
MSHTFEILFFKRLAVIEVEGGGVDGVGDRLIVRVVVRL